jgi:hypothetical protein
MTIWGVLSMVNANVLRLFGFMTEETEKEEDVEELAWSELPFVSRSAGGELSAWSPPVVDVEAACAKSAERIKSTEMSIGESYGLQLIAHMLRYGSTAQVRLTEIVTAMHMRGSWGNIERGFLNVIGSYVASNDGPFLTGAAARIQAARAS